MEKSSLASEFDKVCIECIFGNGLLHNATWHIHLYLRNYIISFHIFHLSNTNYWGNNYLYLPGIVRSFVLPLIRVREWATPPNLRVEIKSWAGTLIKCKPVGEAHFVFRWSSYQGIVPSQWSGVKPQLDYKLPIVGDRTCPPEGTCFLSTLATICPPPTGPTFIYTTESI